MAESKNLILVGLYAENFKRLKMIEILPDGSLVQITGGNTQGKTSCFDAIWVALDGLKNCQKMPIRDGEEQAVIQVKLAEKLGEEAKIIVTRTFQKTPDGFDSKLTVEAADRTKFSSPQAVLDAFIGSLMFDPLAFSRMSVKEQFEQLKQHVTDFDFAKAEADNKKDFDDRTVINRALANAKGVEVSVKDAPLEEPEKPDTKTLTDRLANAAIKNAAIDKEQKERADRRIKEVIEPLERAKNEQKGAQSLYEAAQKAYKEAEVVLTLRSQQLDTILNLTNAAQDSLNTLPPLEALEDVAAVKVELDAATPKLALWSKWDKRREARKAVAEHEAKAKELTSNIEKRNADKIKAISESKLPVPGMTLGDDTVLLNGVPFDQSSGAEKLMASVKMAMATNPTLKIILIKDGSLLDTKSMEMLAKMAEENGYQVWIERVDGSGAVGFVIEDGRLKKG